MKKRILAIVMIIVCISFSGCTKDEGVSSLSKNDMVFSDVKNSRDFI